MKKQYIIPQTDIIQVFSKSELLHNDMSGVLRGKDTMGNEGNSFDKDDEFEFKSANLWDN